MDIVLKHLSLTNFKGIQHLSISFSHETNIKGANESGKSTIVTAFFWLLTGKDEFDRKDYEIKNTARKELNAQAHEVEAIFEVNGDEIKLKRVYLEKWTKPKGQSQKVFEGHKTEFYFNDVPCNQSEFQTKVDGIIPANLIKLLTNPYFFNNLPWEKQRSALLQMAGNITNNEVIEKIATPENDFSSLINVLNGGKTIEDYKKQLSAKKKLLKDKADQYMPRIDEAKRSKPEEKAWSAMEKELAKVNAEIEKIDMLLSNASKALSEKQKGIHSLQHNIYAKQTAFDKIKASIRADVENKPQQAQQKLRQLQVEIEAEKRVLNTLNQSLQTAQFDRTRIAEAITTKENIINKLREDWNYINKEVFEFDENPCTCPTCKQLLPADNIEKKKEELLANFNQSKINRKQSKVDESARVKAEKANLEKQLFDLNEAGIQSQISEQQNKIVTIENKITNAQAEVSKHTTPDIELVVNELLKLNGDALNLQDEINSLEGQVKAATEKLSSENDNETEGEKRKELLLKSDQIKKDLALKSVIENTDKRIEQLLLEEEENGQAIADVEKQEYEIELFTRAKMDILEEKVNKLFRYVKFRMFSKQVNGEIAETCICEYQNVPYPTLNTAGKLLAGIDVLNTLSEYYHINAPVFCDNRESVTWIPECKSQIVSLYVSPEHKKLKIEQVGKPMIAQYDNSVQATLID